MLKTTIWWTERSYMLLKYMQIKEQQWRELELLHKVEQTELEKELLILQILILQREKIDKEAAVILSDSVPFGVEDKAKEKKKKERDKKQKALIDKLNEFGISNLDIDVKPPKNSEGREKGGMERKQRIR